ncbi:acyltransferase [Nocardioides sp. CPCC 205120]|uniref:acyltransferase n=1 Tax=Nocardioides sp. CPCC 205120 TaxID=3406462 RepID=UPI003B50A7E0
MEQRSANRAWNLLVNGLAASPHLTEERRRRLYRRGGIDLTRGSIRPGCWFFSSSVTFGSGGMVNTGCVFENREQVTVGDGVYFGPQVLVGTSTHQVGGPEQRAGDYAGAPVVIEDGCWIGARATILPGVTIARGCVIAAGAVVTTSTEPDGLYAGVPAVRKGDL